MIRARVERAQAVVIRALGLLFLVVLLVAPAQASAGFAPEPGPWVSGAVAVPGARGVIRFDVDPGTGLLQPVVRYRLRRCGVSERVSLGLVAAAGRRFELVSRHRVVGRQARVRLRFAGRFDSSFEAHGVLRGRVALRGRACRIPALSWTAEAGGPPLVDEADEEPGGEIEEELEEDDCEDCEEIPVDEDEGDDPALPLRTPPPT